MDLAEYYEEVTKTAGLKPEVEADEEKIAAVAAVAEQFDIDGIEFDDEDEKIAAAIAIVEGFEEGMEKDAGKEGRLAQRARVLYKSGRNKIKRGYEKTKAHVSAHKGKYGLGAGAAAGLGGGYAVGRSRN